MFERYNRDAEKSLEPLYEPASAKRDVSLMSDFGLGDLDEFDIVDAPPAYLALRHAIRQARRRAAKIRSKTNRR